MKDIEQALKESAARLRQISETPLLDAQVLVSFLLGKPRAWILAHNDHILSSGEESALETMLSRLENGEPLPYMLGRWEFFGLEFYLSPVTLIPRPETELLVEQALSWLGANPDRRLAADVGAGSGCIAVTLAVNIKDLKIIASDLSLPALSVARLNALKHGVSDRVEFLQTDLLSCLDTRFDLICANLPYIPSSMLKTLNISSYEPRLALDGGTDGLDQIRRLLDAAPMIISDSGLVLIEIEASAGETTLSLAKGCFTDAQVRIHQDLAGRDRLITIQSRL